MVQHMKDLMAVQPTTDAIFSIAMWCVIIIGFLAVSWYLESKGEI